MCVCVCVVMHACVIAFLSLPPPSLSLVGRGCFVTVCCILEMYVIICTDIIKWNMEQNHTDSVWSLLVFECKIVFLAYHNYLCVIVKMAARIYMERIQSAELVLRNDLNNTQTSSTCPQSLVWSEVSYVCADFATFIFSS